MAGGAGAGAGRQCCHLPSSASRPLVASRPLGAGSASYFHAAAGHHSPAHAAVCGAGVPRSWRHCSGHAATWDAHGIWRAANDGISVWRCAVWGSLSASYLWPTHAAARAATLPAYLSYGAVAATVPSHAASSAAAALQQVFPTTPMQQDAPQSTEQREQYVEEVS